MNLRQIHISNPKERNSLIGFKGFPLVSNTIKTDKDGTPTINKKIIKGISTSSLDGLKEKFDDDLDKIAEGLIASDPEIDIQTIGKFLTNTPRVLVNDSLQVVYKVDKKEKVFNPKGELVEERDVKQLFSNILGDTPLKWSGKLLPKAKAFNKFVFVRSYQLQHDSGLTYDFLYDIAKELSEKDSLMLIGSGAKGIGPVIFQDGGTPFKVFLEGRIKDDQYMLLMHLSNLELKSLNKEN